MTKTLYKNINLFDSLHNKIFKHAYMLIDNKVGKITQIGTGDNLPKADKVIDIKNKYIMPGLFNVHTHVSDDPNGPAGIKPDNPIHATVRAVRHLHQLVNQRLD